MKYFKAINNIDDLKKEYKKLAMMYHPDRPQGNTQIMQAINAEYEKMFELVKDIHKGKNGSEYSKPNKENYRDYMDIINKIIHLDIIIEICGSWIWLTGNTYQYKDLFHNIGFKWSKSKVAWYWSNDIGEEKIRYSRYDLNTIRQKFGSDVIETEKLQTIRA